jgi:hypothetical protein
MRLIERGDVAATIYGPVRESQLRHVLDGPPKGVRRAGGWVFSEHWLTELRSELEQRLDQVDPIDPGIPRPSEPWADAIEPLLGFERRGAKLYRPGAGAELGARAEAALKLDEQLKSGRVRVHDRVLARYLEGQGRLVRLGADHAISAETYQRAREAVLAEFAAHGEITLPRFRDVMGIGRNTAQLLLERFDADGLTRRIGDRRIVRRSASR